MVWVEIGDSFVNLDEVITIDVYESELGGFFVRAHFKNGNNTPLLEYKTKEEAIARVKAIFSKKEDK